MGSPGAAYSLFTARDYSQTAICDDLGAARKRALPSSISVDESTREFSEDRWADDSGNQWIRYRGDDEG